MCENCGCGEGSGYSIINPAQHDHHHNHDHDHHHHHHQDYPHTHEQEFSPQYPHEYEQTHEYQHEHGLSHTHERIEIGTNILHENDLMAQRNRGFFEARNITALNLVSSPGSGKTTILERTITSLKDRKIYVIEGDQQTTLDAERIHSTGIPVLQVNTGNGCHLDASMINQAVKTLDPQQNALLLIENVGNLVCPALFDLGEQKRVVIISVTEGEDKPLKYPNMFMSSQLCVINKTDLVPYLDFSTEKLKQNAQKVNPHIEFIELSAKTGDGFERWLEWLIL